MEGAAVFFHRRPQPHCLCGRPCMSPLRNPFRLLVWLSCLALTWLPAQPVGLVGSGILGAGSTGVEVTGTGILTDGRVVLAANLGTQQPTTGSTHWSHLDGGSLVAGAGSGMSGAVLVLSADGTAIETVCWIGDGVWDLAVDGADRIHVAAGTAGLVTLNAAADTLLGQRLTDLSELGDLSGKTGIAIGDFERLFVERVDASEAGDVVALLPTKLVAQGGADNLGQVLMVVFGADGTQRASFAGNSQHTNDVAISSHHNRVVFLGYRVTSAVVNSDWLGSPQWSFPVHIPYLGARDLDGNLLWIGYNWETNPWTDGAQTLPNPDFLNFPFSPPAYDGTLWNWHANNMADTRGYRVCFGRDGLLYAAFESAGGNTPLRWNPFDLTDAVELIGGDPWFNFNQTASEHKTVFLRYEPETGEPLIGQYFTTRYKDPNTGALVGNSAFMRRGGMAVDADGRLYIGGLAASGLPLWPSPGYTPLPGEITFNPLSADAYTGGGWFLIVSPDFRHREYMTRLSSDSQTLAVDARTVGGQPRAVWAGRQTLLDGEGDPTAYYEHNPVLPAESGTERGGFYALLGPGGQPLDQRATVTDLRFTSELLLGNSNLRNTSLSNTVLDFDNNGTSDTLGHYAFSLTEPLTQGGANYRGMPIYGGVELLTLDTSNHTAAFRLDTTFKAIFGTGIGGLPQRLAALFVVKKDDFFNTDSGSFIPGTGSLLWMRCAQFGSDLEARWVVRDGSGSWLVSETTWDPATGWHSLSASDRWADYAPETALWWDAGAAVFTERTLGDVQVLGVWIGGGNLGGDASIGLRLNQFTVQADRRTSTGLAVRDSGIATSAASPGRGTYLSSDPISFSLPGGLDAGSQVQWQFGDGTSSALETPQHAFAAAGSYLVTATVTNQSGDRNVTSKWIHVENASAFTDAPDAVIDADSLIGELPFCALLDGGSSTGDNLTYAWDFGNGDSATGPTANPCFESSGTFAVTLTVTDPAGRHDTAYAFVKAVTPAPEHPRLVLDESRLEEVRSKVAVEGTIQRNIYLQMLEAAKPESEGGEGWYASFDIINPEAGTPALLPWETAADLPGLYLDGQPNPALVAAAAAVADDPATRDYLNKKALELVFFLIKPRSDGISPQSDLYYAAGTPETEKYQPGDDPLGIYNPIHGQTNPLTGRPYLGRSDVSLERYGRRYERQWAVTNSALFRGTEMKAVAMAYDFCYDLWLADDLANGTNNVDIISRAIVQQADSLRIDGGPGWPGNDAYGSNWYAIRYSMSGLGYLVADSEYDPASLDYVDSRFRLYAEANMGSSPSSMGWNIEGYGYAGFSMPFAHAYMIAHKLNDSGSDYYQDYPGMRLQPFSMFQGVLPIPSFQDTGMSTVYPGKLKLGVRPDFSDDAQFTWETSGLEGLAFHPEITPAAYVPGLRWLFDRLCGELGDGTFGSGYTRSFYSLFFYPDEVPPENPELVWGRHYFDPTFGIFLMRDRYTADTGLNGTPYNEDIVFGTTANMRVAQGGHSAPDQHGLRLWGLGLPWLVGGGRTSDAAGQSTLFAFDPAVSVHRFNPGEVADYYLRPAGGGYTVTSSGLLSSVGTEYHTRRTVVSFDEERTGAKAVLIVADTSNNGRYWRINTAGCNTIQLTGERTFTITLDPAQVSSNPNFPTDLVANPPVLHGRILTPADGILSQGTVDRPAQFESARIYGQDFPVNRWVEWEATGGDTDFVVALSLVPGATPAPSVTWNPGDGGIRGIATIGSQTFDFQGEKPVVSGWERPEIAFDPDQADYFLYGNDLVVSGTVVPVPGRSIDRVEVEVDGSIAGLATLGGSGTLTWQFVLPGLPVGDYTVRAIAHDDAEEWSQTAQQVISVTHSVPPEVDLLTPGQQQVFRLGEQVVVTGWASDPDGSVSGVEVYVDRSAAGPADYSSDNGSWTFAWTPVKADKYSVTAVATDNSGDQSWTGELSFSVSSVFSDQDSFNDLADFYHDQRFVEVIELEGEPVIWVKPNTGSDYRDGIAFKGGDVAGDVRLRFKAKAAYDRTKYPLEWYEIAVGGSVWYRMTPSFSFDQGTSLMLENSGDGMVWHWAREHGIPDDDWHQIEVERVNDNMRLFLDGRIILNFAEPRLANPGTARISLPWRQRNISMYFKDIELETIGRDAAVAPSVSQQTLLGREVLVTGDGVLLSGEFAGGSDPVATVNVYSGSRIIGAASLDHDSGTWQFLWMPETVGGQALTVAVVDSRGRTGWSDPVTVEVAAAARPARVEPPVITVFDPVGPVILAPGEAFELRGRATGGSHKLSGLWLETASGVGRAVSVDADGYWRHRFAETEPGEYLYRLRASAASGLVSTVDGIRFQIGAPSPDLPVRLNLGPAADLINHWHTFDGTAYLPLFGGMEAAFNGLVGGAFDAEAGEADPSTSFIRMAGRELQLRVPNGLYDLEVAVGDPLVAGGGRNQRLSVQGTVVLNQTTTPDELVVVHTETGVLVTDSQLRLADLSTETGICWLILTRSGSNSGGPSVEWREADGAIPRTWGTGLTLPLAVNALPGSGGAPVEIVRFYVDGQMLQEVPVAGGSASLEWIPAVPGIHDIVAWAVDADGNSWGGDYRRVDVLDGFVPPPKAFLSASELSGELPLTVTFDASGTWNPAGSDLRYDWNFGNGLVNRFANGSPWYDYLRNPVPGLDTIHPTMTFRSAGTYRVTLMVSNALGGSDSHSIEIIVTGREVVVDDPAYEHIRYKGRWDYWYTQSRNEGPYLWESISDNYKKETYKGTKEIWIDPQLPGAGYYRLYEWSPYSGSPVVNLTVNHVSPPASGSVDETSVVTYSQQASANSWQELGTFYFDPNRDPGLWLPNAATSGNLYADAFRWVAEGPLANAVFSFIGDAANGMVHFDADTSVPGTPGGILSYTWDFGDGASASGNPVEHTFSESGPHDVLLTVSDSTGSASTRLPVTIPSAPGPPLFINGPDRVDAGQAASFQMTTDGLGSLPGAPLWDFGDGVQTTGTGVAHTWQYPGVYRLTLVLPDGDDGILARSEKFIDVTSSPSNTSPAATISINRTSGYAPLSVALAASGSADLDGAIVAMYWDFGDGSNSTETAPSHVYESPGVFTITLTVTDDDGATGQAVRTVTVSEFGANRAPVAVISADPASGIVPLTTTFSAEASFDLDGDSLSYTWSGPGISGTEPRLTHTFTEVGIHPVTLTVSDGTLSDSMTANIVVQPEVTLPVVDVWVVEAEAIRSISQPAVIEFVRQADDISGSLTVTYAPAAASVAVEGVDFQLDDGSGELTFAPFETRKTLSLLPLAVAEPTGPKPVEIEIVAEDYYLIGARSSAGLVVRDTDFSVDAGLEQTVAASSPGGLGTVMLAGTSTDPGSVARWIWSLDQSGQQLGSGQSVLVDLPVGGPFQIRLTGESDSLMEAVHDVTRVTVVDYGQLPPVAAVAPTDPVLALNGRFAEVDLDGTPSSDPDGSVAAWTWYLGGSPVATGPVTTVSLHVGTHDLVLRVADNDGNVNETDFTVEVLDATYEAYLIDFGPVTPVTPGWNKVDRFHTGGIFDNQPRTDSVNLVSTYGTESAAVSEIAFHSSRLFDLGLSYSLEAPASDWITSDAGGDGLMIYDENGSAFLDFAVSGLDDGKRFRVELFCTRNDANWESLSVWVNSLPATGPTASIDFQMRFNVSKTFVWDNMLPSSGRFRVHMAGPEGLSKRIPVIAMRLEEVKTYPADSHRLSLTSNHPERIELSGGGRVFPGDTVMIDAVITDPDYRFVQWSDGNTASQRPVTMASDLSLFALVEPVNPPTGLDTWITLNWPGETDTAVIGQLADPDLDGLVNLLEYALGSSPVDPADRGQLLIEPTPGGSLQLRFGQVADPLLTYQVQQRTADPDTGWLGIWESSGEDNSDGEQSIEPVNTGARTDLYRLSVTYGTSP